MSRQLNQHRRWLEENHDHVKARELAYLKRDLASDSMRSAIQISTSLGMLALCHAATGICEISDARPQGWASIELSMSYHFACLHLRLESALRLPDQAGLTGVVPAAANILCYSLVGGLTEWSDSMSRLLLTAVTGRGFVSEEYWRERSFEPFALWLFARMGAANSVPTGELRIGPPYSSIIAAWNNDEHFPQAIHEACDYHCGHVTDTRKWDPEFDGAPFDLFPVEILAALTIRNRTRPPHANIGHPLTESPFANYRPTNPGLADPVLADVWAWFRAIFGS